MTKVISITSVDQFESHMSEESGVVFVDFYADWCGPCKMIAPTIDSLAEKYEGKAKVVKVDIDAMGELAQKYQVMSIPTVKVFVNGKDVETKVGALPPEQYEAAIEKHLD